MYAPYLEAAFDACVLLDIMVGNWIAWVVAVTGLLGIGVSGCTSPVTPPRAGQASSTAPPTIVTPRDGQEPPWGPLAVIDEPATAAAQAGLGPGTLHIGAECVTLQMDGFVPSTLIWRSPEVRWDRSGRDIVFASARDGEVRLSDGDTIMVGGTAMTNPAPIWLAEPHATCPAARFAVHDVVR